MYDVDDANENDFEKSISNKIDQILSINSLAPQNTAKRNSWVNPIKIKLFNSTNNLTTTKSTEKLSNGNLSSSSNNLLSIMDGRGYHASRENRFSLSVDKFQQGQLLSKTNLREDLKGKSQSDLTALKNTGLSNSMYNMSRSSSIYSNELDCTEINKYRIEKSQLNGLFALPTKKILISPF